MSKDSESLHSSSNQSLASKLFRSNSKEWVYVKIRRTAGMSEPFFALLELQLGRVYSAHSTIQHCHYNFLKSES